MLQQSYIRLCELLCSTNIKESCLFVTEILKNLDLNVLERPCGFWQQFSHFWMDFKIKREISRRPFVGSHSDNRSCRVCFIKQRDK